MDCGHIAGDISGRSGEGPLVEHLALPEAAGLRRVSLERLPSSGLTLPRGNTLAPLEAKRVKLLESTAHLRQHPDRGP
jgi:hypothetical protein